MIVLGVILLLLGYLLPVPFPIDSLLITGGWILVVVGIILFVLGSVGRPIGGRRYWW